MNRQKALVVAYAAILAGIILGCSMASRSAAPRSHETLGDRVYASAGVAMYQVKDDPTHYAVQVVSLKYRDPATHTMQPISFQDAMNRVPDSAKINTHTSWYRVPVVDAFKPGLGGRGAVPNTDERPTFIPDDPSEGAGTFHCPCEQCTWLGGTNCQCSWGCLKDIYH